jgi:hypothetical protein
LTWCGRKARPGGGGILINATVPDVDAVRAQAIVTASGCATAKVKVADHPDSLWEDLARLEAVRDALGRAGAVRVDANGVWDVETAVAHIAAPRDDIEEVLVAIWEEVLGVPRAGICDGFFEATDPTELVDDALYAEMLSQYTSWLQEAKRAGVLRS